MESEELLRLGALAELSLLECPEVLWSSCLLISVQSPDCCPLLFRSVGHWLSKDCKLFSNCWWSPGSNIEDDMYAECLSKELCDKILEEPFPWGWLHKVPEPEN